MKTLLAVILVLVLVGVVGVGAFYAGNSYGMSQAQNIRAEFFQGRFGGTGGNGAPTGDASGQGAAVIRGAVSGTVKAVQGNKIEVTTRDGSVTATVDSQTVIQKTVNSAIADVQPGMRITIRSDQTGNNITARTIQLSAAGAP